MDKEGGRRKELKGKEKKKDETEEQVIVVILALVVCDGKCGAEEENRDVAVQLVRKVLQI